MENEATVENTETNEIDQERQRMEELRERILSRLGVPDILKLLEDRIGKALQDVDQMKSELDGVNLGDIGYLVQHIDFRTLEDAVDAYNDYDFSDFVKNEGLENTLEETERKADDAYDKAEEASDGISDLYDRVDAIDRSIKDNEGIEDIRIQVEGFKEELESFSQRQDLMDERIGRFERLYNVVRLALSNDPQ